MLTANGLANDFLKEKFADMLREKYQAKISNGKLKLKALVIWDSCFLKEALWNDKWQCTYGGTALDFMHEENFNHMPRSAENPNGVNAVTPGTVWEPFSSDGVSFDESLLTSDWEAGGDCEKDGMALEPYWCEDFTAAFNQLADDIEIESVPLSLLDKYASNVLKRLVAELSRSKSVSGNPLEVAGWPQEWKDRLTAELSALPAHPGDDDHWKGEIAGYDIIAFDGGNPDLHAFALKMVAPGFMSEVTSQVAAGQIVAIGRSAGAMAMGGDILTFEPNPRLWGNLMQNNASMSGMGLAGACTIRPHYSGKWTPAMRLARQELARSSGAKAVPIKNGEGLRCSHGTCEHYKLKKTMQIYNFIKSCPQCQHIAAASAVAAAKATRDSYDTIVHEKCTDVTMGEWDWESCKASRKSSDKDPYVCIYLWRHCFEKMVTEFCGSMVDTLSKALTESEEIDLTPTQRMRYAVRVQSKCLLDEDVYE